MHREVLERTRHLARRVLPASLTAAVRKHVLHRRASLHSLEFHVTDHCNLNCKGCGHFSCISPQMFADPAQFDVDMARLAGLLDVEIITLLGGEPLLHPRLLEFVVSARTHFPSSHLHITSNGLLLPSMNDQFWQTLHHFDVRLNISDYRIRRDDDSIREKAEFFDVDLVYTDRRDDFYCIPLDVQGSAEPSRSRERCLGVGNCPLMRDGRIYPCAYPPLVFALERRFGVVFPVDENDSVDIRGAADGFEIVEFLARAIPFCRFCDVEHLRHFEWGHTRQSLDEWT